MAVQHAPHPGTLPRTQLGGCVAALWLWSTAAAAIDPAVPLADLHQREWNRFDGAPSHVAFVERTADGMLWLIGRSQVDRFDGLHFHRFLQADGEALSTPTTTAHAADDHGALWLAQATGELLQLHGDTVRRWPPVKALHSGNPVDLAADRQGRIWMATAAGLSMFTEGTWRGFGEADGIQAGQVDAVGVAQDGRIWVLARAGLYVGDPTTLRFSQMDAHVGNSHLTRLALSPQGEVWRRTVDGQQQLCRMLPVARRGCWHSDLVHDLTFDAQGALWGSTGQSVFRVADPARLDPDPDALMRVAERIDFAAESLVFGVDGSLWTVRSEGMGRLRQTPLQQVPTPTGGLAPATDGEIWVGSFTRGLMRVGVPAPGTPLQRANDDTVWTHTAAAATSDLRDQLPFTPVTTLLPPATPVVLSRYPDAQGHTTVRLDPLGEGHVLLATLSPPRLVAHDGRVAREIALPPLDRGSLIRGARHDPQGDLWLAVARHQVPFYRQRAGEWQPYGGVPGVDRTATNGLTLDGDDVWIAIGPDQIGHVRNGTWTRYGPEHGVAVGQVIQTLVHEGRVWVAGTTGLQVRTDGRFVTIIGTDGDRFRSASGVLMLDNGDLWLHGLDGLSRIQRSAWEPAVRTDGHRVAYTRMDHLDGSPSSALQGAPMPTLVRSTDGLLWASAQTALLRIDPARMPAPLPAPQVQVLRFTVDGIGHPLDAALTLPVGARRITVSFTAPPTDVPERIRFRYRLHADAAWIDAGERREVAYDALAPGEHGFEVMASDSEGRWSGTPTRVGFTLPPRFHQTHAFRMLVAGAVILLLAGLYAVRMRQVSARIQRETSARLHERMRISRDLHDTLLQSVQALHMQVQVIAARIPADDPLSTRIASVLERAQDTIREGRDRISTLRDPLAGTSDLAETLQRSAQRLASEADVLCDVQFDTPLRALKPAAYDELLHIGREALGNALRHAQASRVTLRIAFDSDGVRITVRDDGGGFPGEVLAEGGREGHFGLRGMQERAAQIGGQLHVRNVAGQGAEVLIWVPAKHAYLGPDTARQRRDSAAAATEPAG